MKLTENLLAVYDMIKDRGIGRICNDLNPEEEKLLTKDEWKEFLRHYHVWNGDSETFDERTNFMPMDWMVTGFVEHLMKQSVRNSILDNQDIQFLKDLANEIKSQHNRATAMPYFYVIKKTKRVVGMDASYSDDTVFVDTSSGDYSEFKTEEEAIQYEMKGRGIGRAFAEKVVEENYEKFGVLEYEEKHNMFLTYKGLLKHMELNGHNLDRGISYPSHPFKESNTLYSYVEHAFRNPEMEQLMKIIMKFADKRDE